VPDVPQDFGQEIRRLRLAAGMSLRGLSRRLEVSAAHLSDIERNLRRPSDTLLERIVLELQDAGAKAAELLLLMTGLDETTRRWAATTPGVRALLHRCIATGVTPAELIRTLDEAYPLPPPVSSRGKGTRKRG
jgi:transcriptional regulator with XRE-family HTH domain